MRRRYREQLGLTVAVSLIVASCASSAGSQSGRPAPGRRDASDTTASAYGAPRATGGRASRGNRATAEEIARAGNMNLATFIESRLAGVRVLENRGEFTVLISGAGSRSNPGALVLIDGSEGSLAGLSLPDIVGIEVLKDSAASVYGARGGNGVLMITTRKK